jgi:acyl carrier protein
MKEQLNKIFQRAFGVDTLEDSMSIESVEGWDSMAHVGLIMELQKEFKVSISPADAIELTNVEKIVKYLKENAEK